LYIHQCVTASRRLWSGIAFSWLSPALVEHDLRDYRHYLNNLWRQLLGIGFRLRRDPTFVTAL